MPLFTVWRCDPIRFADRLTKYVGGQVQLVTSDRRILRGPIERIVPHDMEVFFHLLWLAERRRILNGIWRREWRWVLIPRHELLSLFKLQVEIGAAGPSKDQKAEELEPFVKELSVKRFKQNKAGKSWVFTGPVYPKQMFFETSTGEKGILFQKDDPRNIVMKDGEVIDPSQG